MTVSSAPPLPEIGFILANFQTALDQPFFPGGVLLWLLFMASLFSWAIILSKALSFRKYRKSDLAFTHRLRRSRTTMEIFEDGWDDEESLKYQIYLAGARETAFQLLGKREPRAFSNHQLSKAGRMNATQLKALQSAFVSGMEAAQSRVRSGLGVLRLIAMVSPMLGLGGLGWMLMRGFDNAASFEEIAPWVSGSLSYLVLSLCVCVPATVALIVFATFGREKMRILHEFTQEITRLFERSFAAAELLPNSSDSSHTSTPESARQKKEYHSIRRVLEPEKTAQTLKEEPINPIAQQAAALASSAEGV